MNFDFILQILIAFIFLIKTNESNQINTTTLSEINSTQLHNMTNETNEFDYNKIPYCSILPCNLKYCFYYKTRIDGVECIECGCD